MVFVVDGRVSFVARLLFVVVCCLCGVCCSLRVVYCSVLFVV